MKIEEFNMILDKVGSAGKAAFILGFVYMTKDIVISAITGLTIFGVFTVIGSAIIKLVQ